MTTTLHSDTWISTPHHTHRVVIRRAPERSAVEHRLAALQRGVLAGVVDPHEFAVELAAEHDRRQRGGRDCLVASIALFEIPSVRHRLGSAYVFDLISDVTRLLQRSLAPLDLINISEDGEIFVMAREAPIAAAAERIERVCREIAANRFDERGEHVLLTPSTGYATLDDGRSPEEVLRRAVDAREVAATHLDLRVHRWLPEMSADTAPPERPRRQWRQWPVLKERLRTPLQILATYLLGLVVPFGIYWLFDRVIGIDVTFGVYVFVVATLVLTGAMIMVEAVLAVHQKEPPPVDGPYSDATAIICAYLPNEAGTILDTVEAFLNLGYPGNLQILLAYNTPTKLPVEEHLYALAAMHANLDVVRVEGSNSKAQNVNAVLHLATGEFTGMFDADHEPRPGSFERAWRWLSNGYDVVQGHCLTRNGEASWLARMIAVEFESIYAVAHPGRARLHHFGVFGGSNGYWRTGLLHETRMRGSMLTEDIDSSMRAVERGCRIRSDRNIVSRELGTTTFKQVWNQRMRWSQGWLQVTIQHSARIWRTPHLALRQKVGASYLLGWREVYPWLSLQVIPLVAYWLLRGDSLSAGWPIFFLSTLFVLQIGPMQTYFAYRLADPEIKAHRSWFVAYLFFSTIFYTEYKNTIARVSHIKEWMGERTWRVTPRSEDPVDLQPLTPDAETTNLGEAADDHEVAHVPREGHVPSAPYDDHADREAAEWVELELRRQPKPARQVIGGM